MLALLRLVIIGLIALTALYIALSIWSRSARRRKLAAEWEEAPTGNRETFIAQGLAEYETSLRRKLILGVYVVPTILVALIIYLTNFA